MPDAFLIRAEALPLDRQLYDLLLTRHHARWRGWSDLGAEVRLSSLHRWLSAGLLDAFRGL
jgi:hypothetical protein